MMYLIAFPSLSSLYLLMHSGETETLLRTLGVSGGSHIAEYMIWFDLNGTERTLIYSIESR